MKDYQILIKSYRQLFSLTGRVEFFTMYKNMEKTKTAILLEEKQQELSI
jgi:hypothetical protein